MKSFKVSDKLPFYWRLRSETQIEHSLTYAPFEFENTSSGILVQKKNSSVLEALDEVYKLPANIGYLQEGYSSKDGYFDDIIGFINHSLKEEDWHGLFVEIGCGGMMILDYLRRNGMEVLGIDPSPLSLRMSQQKNIPLINDFFTENIDLPEVHVFFHYDVLEHICDLRSFLTLQYQALSEDGLIVFSVPNPEPSLKLGDVSMAMHQHINYFSRHSLSKLLREIGFSEIKCAEAKYGGSLNISARKKMYQLEQDEIIEDSNLENIFFQKVEKAQSNFKNRLSFLSSNLSEIGLYVPLRALPYLELISEATNGAVLRLIDDADTWNGKYFDGVPFIIENFHQYSVSPAKMTIIFSLTFEHKIIEKIRPSKLEIVSLRELIE